MRACQDVSGWSFDKMGLLAAVPYLFMAIVVQCQGQLADLLRTRFKIKTTTVMFLLSNKIWFFNF